MIAGCGRGYRWIALDLDDTLLGPDRRVGENALEAVDTVQSRGGVAILATGRPYASARMFADRLRIRGPIVASSGAVIRDADGASLRELYLTPEVVGEVIDDAAARDLVAYVYTVDATRATREHPDTARYSLILEEDIPVVEHPPKEGVYALALRVDAGDGAGIEADLRCRFLNRAVILRPLPSLIEVLPPMATKGEALRFLSARLNLSLEDLVAVGDGPGDLDMLEVAGCGVAVANAPEGLRAAADYVTQRPYDAGVLDAVTELFCGRNDG